MKPGPKPRQGPLALVIESDLPSAEQAQFGYRGARFVRFSNQLPSERIAETIRIVWLDDRISLAEKKRIKKFIDTDRVAVFEKSSSIGKLRDILERRLPPLPQSGQIEQDQGNNGGPIVRDDRESFVIEIRKLREELTRTQQDLVFSESKLAEVMRENERLARSTRSVSSLPRPDPTVAEAKARDLAAKLIEAKAALAMAQAEIKKLKAESKKSAVIPATDSVELSDLRKVCGRLERENRAQAGYAVEQSRLIEDLRRQLDTAARDLHAFEKEQVDERRKYKNAISELRDQLRISKGEREHLSTQLERVERNLSEARSKLALIEGRDRKASVEIRGQMQHLNDENQRLTRQVEQLDESRGILEAQVRELLAEIRRSA